MLPIKQCSVMFFQCTGKNSPVLIHGQTSGSDRNFSATTEPRLELPNSLSFQNPGGWERRKALPTGWSCPALDEEIPQRNSPVTNHCQLLCFYICIDKYIYLYFLRNRKPFRREHTEEDHPQALSKLDYFKHWDELFHWYGLWKRS